MGRYRSIQATMIESALKGITDNHTITAYKQDIKRFAVYCKMQGAKRPSHLQGKELVLLQGYEKELESSGYTASTIHRRLAAPCKALNVSMGQINKPKRTASRIIRSRNPAANKQGKMEVKDPKYSRLVRFQRAVGIRRAELSKLTRADLTMDESGCLCVRVRKGKGGKMQLQRILPEDEEVVIEIFQTTEGERLFSDKEMDNKIDLHSIRREHAQAAYRYYLKCLKEAPELKEVYKVELMKRFDKYHKSGNSRNAFITDIMNEKPYLLRGENRKKAKDQGKPTEYNRLALMMVSVFHLSHWRLDVTITNYMV